jgi:hypothetical protein
VFHSKHICFQTNPKRMWTRSNALCIDLIFEHIPVVSDAVPSCAFPMRWRTLKVHGRPGADFDDRLRRSAPEAGGVRAVAGISRPAPELILYGPCLHCQASVSCRDAVV